jgi:hypothetical protein
VIKEIKLLGLSELQQRTGWDMLVQPEIMGAMNTILARIQRGGSGLGAQRNTLLVEAQPLAATVTSTLHNPRQKGTTWGRKNEAIVRAMAQAVFRKAIGLIQARWAFSTRSGF